MTTISMEKDPGMDGFEPIALDKVFRFFDHGGVFLASASDGDDADIMTLAWACPIGLDKVAAMVSPGHYTRGLVDRTGLFALMVPTASIVRVAANLGTVTKWRDRDKLGKSGADIFRVPGWDMPFVHGCSAFAVFETIPQGIPGPVCGRALAAWADRSLFTVDRWAANGVPVERRSLRYAPGGRWLVAGDPVWIDLDWEKPV